MPSLFLSAKFSEISTMPNKVCPHCGKEFPRWYWGVTGKFGGFGTVRKPGLARANFERHVKACKKKTNKEQIDGRE